MPRLFVTGLAGLLGSALSRAGRDAGWEVAGTVRSRPAPGGMPVDVRDESAVGDALRAARPDAVVHTAYDAGDESVNVDGARAVARASAGAGLRLLHLSTDLVFDGSLGRPYTEEDPPSPWNDYGRGKARAEELVASAHPGASIVRTSLLLDAEGDGPQERMVRAGGSFYADEWRCPLCADDLAGALLALVATDHSGLLHIAGPEAMTRLELARRIASHLGLDPDAVRGGTRPAGRAGDVRLDSGRAAALLHTPIRAP